MVDWLKLTASVTLGATVGCVWAHCDEHPQVERETFHQAYTQVNTLTASGHYQG